eukprot:gene34466-42504_t
MRHGQGQEEDRKNGTMYNGAWEQNKEHGRGALTHTKNRDERLNYIGNWEFGKRNGRGIMCYPNGDKWEGRWKKDVIHGDGVMRYADGTVYKGEWRDDLKFSMMKMSHVANQLPLITRSASERIDDRGVDSVSPRVNSSSSSKRLPVVRAQSNPAVAKKTPVRNNGSEHQAAALSPQPQVKARPNGKIIKGPAPLSGNRF